MADILFSKRRVQSKRLPQKIDVAKGIHLYDADNLYPQRIKELSFRSPLAKQAIEVQADFIIGYGWENETSGETIANADGYTFNDLLGFLSRDYSLFMGLGIHFNFNGLGQIIEVNFLPFEFTRFGMPDNFGKHATVKVSSNWETASMKNRLGGLPMAVEFPLFNPLTAQEGVLKGKGGQVLYFTTIPDLYPLSSIDAIAEAVQTDAVIQLYELNNSSHGFHGGTVMLYPGTFDTDEEEAALTQKVGELTGVDGPGIMVIAADEDMDVSKMITNITGNDTDKLFEHTTTHVRETITQNFAVPPVLLGILPDSGVFSQSAMQDGYIYYNLKTRKFRTIMARIFASFGQLWHTGALEFGKIKEREYITPVFRQEVVKPDGEPDEKTEQEETEAKLIAIYGNNGHLISTV